MNDYRNNAMVEREALPTDLVIEVLDGDGNPTGQYRSRATSEGEAASEEVAFIEGDAARPVDPTIQ